MSQITEQDVAHLATLARLRMDEAEKSRLAGQLGAIVGFIDKLKEVDTEGVEPTAQVTGLEDVFRKDEPYIGAFQDKPLWYSPELLVPQAPDHQGNMVKVKAIMKKKE